jgi:phage terminase large subunit-like protein
MLRDYFGGTTETIILTPRKQGKSTIVAAIALFHLVTTPDAECVIVAASREQAGILFGQAAGFVRRSEWLRALLRQQRDVSRPLNSRRPSSCASTSGRCCSCRWVSGSW